MIGVLYGLEAAEELLLRGDRATALAKFDEAITEAEQCIAHGEHPLLVSKAIELARELCEADQAQGAPRLERAKALRHLKAVP